jgi:hypothetical protein
MQASDSSTGCKIGLIGPLFRCLDYFIDLQTTENNKEKFLSALLIPFRQTPPTATTATNGSLRATQLSRSP